MLQINEKSPASSPMIIHNTYPGYSSNDQKNVLLSNATPIGVHKMQSADCTRAVLGCRFSTRPTNISALMMRIKRKFPRSY